MDCRPRFLVARRVAEADPRPSVRSHHRGHRDARPCRGGGSEPGSSPVPALWVGHRLLSVGSWPSYELAARAFPSRPACGVGAQTGHARHQTREACARGAVDARQPRNASAAGSKSPSSLVTSAAVRSVRCAPRPRRPCSICGRTRVIAAAPVRATVISATSVSVSRSGPVGFCGRERPCHFVAEGRPTCLSCSPRRELACADCGAVAPPSVRWPEGPVCEPCYRAASRDEEGVPIATSSAASCRLPGRPRGCAPTVPVYQALPLVGRAGPRNAFMPRGDACDACSPSGQGSSPAVRTVRCGLSSRPLPPLRTPTAPITGCADQRAPPCSPTSPQVSCCFPTRRSTDAKTRGRPTTSGTFSWQTASSKNETMPSCTSRSGQLPV